MWTFSLKHPRNNYYNLIWPNIILWNNLQPVSMQKVDICVYACSVVRARNIQCGQFREVADYPSPQAHINPMLDGLHASYSGQGAYLLLLSFCNVYQGIHISSRTYININRPSHIPFPFIYDYEYECNDTPYRVGL